MLNNSARFAGGAGISCIMVTPFDHVSLLVVEDEPFTRTFTVQMARQLGVSRIAEAGSGAAALSMIKEAPQAPDVILCDLNLPDLDGIEFLRYLADHGSRAGIALISNVDRRVLRTAEQLAETHGLRMLGAVPKPLTLPALRGILERQAKAPSRRLTPTYAPLTVGDVDTGLTAGSFFPVFQPKVAISDGALIGFEALARWDHPRFGRIGPDAFVPMIEDAGFALRLTDHMLMQSIGACGDWARSGLRLSVAVNLSVDALGRLDLPEQIVALAEEAGIRPDQVTLEVTEGRLLRDDAGPLDVLTRLRMKGMGLSLDDFGTGYASMQRLKHVPFNELKVDRSFVSGALNDPESRAILESAINLAKRLDLTVVAEGIETEEDWHVVARMGCDVAQGYFISEPIDGLHVPEWVRSWQRRAHGTTAKSAPGGNGGAA